MAVNYAKCCREFLASPPADNCFVSAWLENNRIRRTVQIHVSDKITTPLTYGIASPVILLPKTSDWDNSEWLGYVLEHEMTHIKRFDALTKLILSAAVCLHWFNPMVWAMYVLANRDLEISCDQTVIWKFGLPSASSYAMTLMEMQQKNNRCSTVYSSFSRYAIEERIKSIMKHKKQRLRLLLWRCWWWYLPRPASRLTRRTAVSTTLWLQRKKVHISKNLAETTLRLMPQHTRQQGTPSPLTGRKNRLKHRQQLFGRIHYRGDFQ